MFHIYLMYLDFRKGSDDMIRLDLPIVETNRCILRPLMLEDANDMFVYAHDEKTTKYVAFPRHQTLADSQYVLENIFLNHEARKTPPTYAIVLKANNQMIGTCDVTKKTLPGDIGELGYILNKQYWGQGIMSEVVEKVLEIAFLHSGFHSIRVTHAVENIGSQKVIEKSGFQYEGVLRAYMFQNGVYYDMKSYSLLQSEYAERKKQHE